MEHLRSPSFFTVFSIGPCYEALFVSFTHKELRALQLDARNNEMRHCIDGYLDRYPIRAVDVAAGQHSALLYHHANVPGFSLELPPATYTLASGDEENVAHVNGLRPELLGYSSESYAAARAAHNAWKLQWRLGFGPLVIAAGVTIVGQEGVELAGEHARLRVRAEGVRFVSMDLPRGAEIVSRSMTMENCTITCGQLEVWGGASLVMEDCRVFGSCGDGVRCNYGKLNATRCTIENHGGDGVYVVGGEAKLVECVVRNNGESGLFVNGGKCILEGGAISGNKQHGVDADGRGKVTVAAAEHSEEVDREQTVSLENGEHDWATGQYGGEIEGLAD